MENLYQNGLFAPPDVAFTSIPERAKKLWIVTTVISSTILGGVPAALLAFLMPWWRDWSPWWAVIPLVAAALWVAWKRFRAPARWRMYGYALDDEQLWVRYGLFERVIDAIPYGRIQAVTVSSGPLERKMRLANLRVYTITGHSTHIEHLDQEVAGHLRERLSNLVLSEGVEL